MNNMRWLTSLTSLANLGRRGMYTKSKRNQNMIWGTLIGVVASGLFTYISRGRGDKMMDKMDNVVKPIQSRVNNSDMSRMLMNR